MTTHFIPTNARPADKGHFESPVLLTYRDRPSRYKVGGWDKTGEGRIEHGGPKVAGPHVFTYEATYVDHADSKREYDSLVAKGLVKTVQPGDLLVIAGTRYVVSDGQWLALVAVAD